MAPTPIPALKQSLETNLDTYQLQIKITISVTTYLLLTFYINLFLWKKIAKYRVKGDKDKKKKQTTFMSKAAIYIKWTQGSDEVL